MSQDWLWIWCAKHARDDGRLRALLVGEKEARVRASSQLGGPDCR